MTRDWRLCRAARGLVGWSQLDLAQHSDVSLSTVRAFEAGELVLKNNAKAMHWALEAAGVIFSTDAAGNPCVSYDANDDVRYEIVRRQRK